LAPGGQGLAETRALPKVLGLMFRARPFWPRSEELVRLKVDLIVTRGTPAALAAKEATIPIVIAKIGEPVNTGVVANLADPAAM